MSRIFAPIAAAGATFLFASAQAATFSSPSSLPLLDFGTGSSPGLVTTSSPGTVGGVTFTFTTGGTPATGLYAGSSLHALTPVGGSSLKDYLAVEPGGSITVTFAVPQTSFGLLWGSVDSYNTLTFDSGLTVDGGQVASALGLPVNIGINENVLISGLTPFTSVSIQSNSPAFEFIPTIPIPEPLSIAVFGTGLLGLGLVRRRSASGADSE